MLTSRRVLRFVLVILLCGLAHQGRGATYLPLSDADLVRRSPDIVRAKVIDQAVVSQRIDGEQLPFTIVQLQTEEVLKGFVPEFFTLRLPGGTVGSMTWRIPGTPTFRSGQEVIVFIHPLGEGTTYGLTEFGLSKFDVMEDSIGQRYAVRPVFDSTTDDFLSQRLLAGTTVNREAAYRDATSFLVALRAQPEADATDIHYSRPHGSLRHSEIGLRPQWVNIGGREPGLCSDGGACLFRWFWDTGASPVGTVSTTGTQTNLTDGSNGLPHVQNAISKWSSIGNTDVRFIGTSAAGSVVVHLDALNTPWGWRDSSDTGAIGCGGGVIGLGGPQSAWGPYTFKNEGPYFAVSRGEVWMRRSNCGSGYNAATFRTAVLHEIGHTLGLGHPDQEQSIHSTTTSAEWNTAVMHSGGYHTPDSPQLDDIRAIQYYYGTQYIPPPPPAGCQPSSTALCLNGRFRAEVSRGRGRGTNATAVPLSADTGYFWFFTSSNVEVVVKVVDGRTVNQSYWVFFAGLSDVDYTLTVTDTTTGTLKVYTNEQGTLASVADTSAFPEGRGRTGAAAVVSESRESFGPLRVTSRWTPEPSADSSTMAASACATTNTKLCLNSSRFQVGVTWRTAAGSSGTATAVAVTSDTGYFWFFSPNNVELVLKVVDGRAFNGRFWVFYGSLSDVAYSVTVTDTLTGVTHVYSNPQGRLASMADTAAF